MGSYPRAGPCHTELDNAEVSQYQGKSLASHSSDSMNLREALDLDEAVYLYRTISNIRPRNRIDFLKNADAAMDWGLLAVKATELHSPPIHAVREESSQETQNPGPSFSNSEKLSMKLKEQVRMEDELNAVVEKFQQMLLVEDVREQNLEPETLSGDCDEYDCSPVDYCIALLETDISVKKELQGHMKDSLYRAKHNHAAVDNAGSGPERVRLMCALRAQWFKDMERYLELCEREARNVRCILSLAEQLKSIIEELKESERKEVGKEGSSPH